MLAPLIVDLMTGSLVVEKIFAIPGVGSLLVNAIQSNDYNVVIALSFIYSAMYIAIMLVVDILYGIIDREFVWQRKETDMVSQENTMNVGMMTAGYIPVEADLI